MSRSMANRTSIRLNRSGRDRRLSEARQIKELASGVCPARGLDDRAALATGLVEPAKAGVVGLHQFGIGRQKKVRDFAGWLGLRPLQRSTGGKQRPGCQSALD